MQETEILKAQELAEEKMVATRCYKESLKLARTKVCVPASTYQDVKLNIATFCAFLWTLFGNKCSYYKELLKVLRVLESADVYAMRESYSIEVCQRIMLAILHEGRHFFDKKLLSTAFTSGRMVDYYPICLLNILDKVHNAELIQQFTYLQAWLTDGEQLRQGQLPGLPVVPPPHSWPTPPTPQAQARTPCQNQAAPTGMGGGRQAGGRQGQGGDN
jgi:hypothetical protein